ncbi:MAG: hypothetical protein CBC13_05780 [Planctomycetia bacterium TMED53]|nr:MAG: hypothetical protein CBC13_05780 [Planctomycetia bacterium TMED53]
MDQSFWSDPEVIRLSEKFVCARLSTYEDAKEGELLKKLYRGRNGELENTVFVMLAPDGKTRLSRSGRTPQMAFGGSVGWESTILALELHAIAQKYPGKENPSGLPPLPVSKDLRRSLNVAACDRQLLVLADRVSESTMVELRQLAWEAPFRGRLGWSSTDNKEEVQAIGLPVEGPAIYICKPGEFGLKATSLKKLSANASTKEIKAALSVALQSARPAQKNYRRHVSRGQRLNKSWETEIKVSDPHIPPRRRE